MATLKGIEAAPESPPLADDQGLIPTFPPVKVDEHGRIVPMDDAELQARFEAIRRAVDAISRIGDVDESPQIAEQVMREIDEERPHRRLFEGMY